MQVYQQTVRYIEVLWGYEEAVEAKKQPELIVQATV